MAKASDTGRQLRMIVLALILLDLLLMSGQLLLYQPLLAQPNAFIYILEPVIGLLAYAAATFWLTRTADPARRTALREATAIGLIGGVLFVINLAAETFLDLPAPASLFATAPFFLGTFALWSVAGYRVASQTGSVLPGIVAAIWSAMWTILITITFGFILSYVALSRLQQNLASSPEYARSGWSDLHAFAVANQFDAAFSHLLTAVVIAAIVGRAGSLIGTSLVRHRMQRT